LPAALARRLPVESKDGEIHRRRQPPTALFNLLIGAGLPSAGGFAGLVRFGFGVGDLAAMEFDEIDFWMAAVADYNRASDEATGARRDNRQ